MTHNQGSAKAVSRRRLLRTGTLGAGALAVRGILPAWASGEKARSCVLTPELTAGPYYVDHALVRKDIREGKPGIPLHLRIAIVDIRTCTPLTGVAVDIWHCDADGVYSAYSKYSPDSAEIFKTIPPPSPSNPNPKLPRSDQQTFLRGVQLSDGSGVAEFNTIYPGWYVTRDTHIHMEIHAGGHTGRDYQGGHVCHIGQLGFDDHVSDAVGRLQPYAKHKMPRTRLEEDSVFKAPLGPDMLLQLEPLSKADLSTGFRGTITVAVDPSVTPREILAGPRTA